MIIVFKIFYAPPNDIMGSDQPVSEKLVELGRYVLITKYLLMELWLHYKILILFLIIAIVYNRKYLRSLQFLTILLVFAGYFLIYVITPNDLNWHLSTSCERLIHQFYPAFVCSFLLSLSQTELPERLQILRDRIKRHYISNGSAVR
jgi:hypothetical protein